MSPASTGAENDVPLKGIFNFTPATTWLQLVAWTAYLVTVLTLFVRRVWSTPAPPRPVVAAAPAAVTAH